jgi:molecular chaperone GrpE
VKNPEKPEENDLPQDPERRGGESARAPSPEADAPRPPEEESVEIESRRAEGERERDALRDDYLRALAEIENTRKRAARERDEVSGRARADALAPLLEILDDLERALGEGGSEGPLRTGVSLIHDKMEAILRRSGVTPIETAGARFDPLLHEAFGGIPSAEAEPHTILQELRRGYLIDGRVLRPARVLVALPAEGGSLPADED